MHRIGFLQEKADLERQMPSSFRFPLKVLVRKHGIQFCTSPADGSCFFASASVSSVLAPRKVLALFAGILLLGDELAGGLAVGGWHRLGWMLPRQFLDIIFTQG